MDLPFTHALYLPGGERLERTHQLLARSLLLEVFISIGVVCIPLRDLASSQLALSSLARRWIEL
jgi:hypothetical protein